MAEEHGFQAPEGHRLCANNCGFFGSPATMNLCSKCYRDLQLKEERDALAKAAFDNSQPASGPGSGSFPSPVASPTVTGHNNQLLCPDTVEVVQAVTMARPEPLGPTQQSNRCLTCWKRVGLTGFRCRCGSMYCGSHRYPEQHECTFDYKTAGKEAIAKANPVIKAEKLEKI